MKAKRTRTQIALGISLLLAGLSLFGFGAYQLFFADDQTSETQQKLAEVTPIEVSDTESKTAEIGQIIAKIRAPRLGADYIRNIAEGTSVEKVLNTVGIGHYVTSQMPGELGNFALAAHRNGNGGPFRNIDKFRVGDEVLIETTSAKYTYRYLETAVVEPTDLGVISPVPQGLKTKVASDSFLTLTTCTPILVNTQRLIVWFALVEKQDK